MATNLQEVRGTTAARTAMTPLVGQLVWDSNEKRLYIGDGITAGGLPVVGPLATSGTLPSDPVGTTSTTGLMMGLGIGITPLVSGNFKVDLVGSMTNNTGGDGAKAQLRHGTGTAPTNGAALTGTTAGSLVEATALSGGQKIPFALTALVTGLALGTAVWFDVGLAAILGGTAGISDLSVVIVELP